MYDSCYDENTIHNTDCCVTGCVSRIDPKWIRKSDVGIRPALLGDVTVLGTTEADLRKTVLVSEVFSGIFTPAGENYDTH